MKLKLLKSLPLAMLLIATPAATQSVPYAIPVSGQLYLAPQAKAPSQYVIRLVTPDDSVVYEQKGPFEADGNGHFDIMLGQGGEELSPKLLGAYPELLVELELDGEVMEGSLPLGSVPYAKLAQEAISAQTLDGKKAEDFLPSDHKPKWDDIQNKPPSSSTSFNSPLIQQGDEVGLTNCADQEVLISRGGQWGCARLPDTATPIQAGDGLLMANNQLSLQPCQEGETLSVVANRWSCAQSSSGGTYIAGTGLELNQNKFSIANKGVTRNLLADDAVNIDKIADGAVDQDKILNSSIYARHMTDNAILTSHIAIVAVTKGKIANNAVTEDKIEANAVKLHHIADDAITTEKIQDGEVKTSDIANNAVDASKIANDSILTRHLSLYSVRGIHIALGANIPAASILNTAVTLNEPTQTFRNNTLHINTSTSRIGIKTTNPAYELDVNGTVRATTFLVPARTVTLPVPAVTMAISPPKSLTLKSAAFVDNETGVKVVTTSSFDTDSAVMSAPIELKEGDMITGFVCYHRTNSTGTPLRYTATIYQQSFTGTPSVVVNLNINEAAGGTSVRQTSGPLAIAQNVVTANTWYFLQIKVPATDTNGIIQGCKIDVQRTQL